MTFAYPLALVMLPALPLALWALRRHERARTARLHNFGQPDLLARASTLPSKRRTAIRQALLLAGLSLLLVATARPQFGQRPASVDHSGRDLLVLLDLSRSMNAADGDIPRLTLAKNAALGVLAGSPGDRVGLVVFGGSAFLQLPLT
ncbi:MAG TPA: VWA domain-containing protein, partial [Gemmatimonadales bacterium]|nr:VWA domain-containing protein [Gemmatimonadales bacterium]